MATIEDIKKKHTRKARAPTSFLDLMETLKAFANLLEALFKPRCPLLCTLQSDIIMPLLKFPPAARSLVEHTTLATILWAVYKEAAAYAMGKTSNTDHTPEWETATGMIRCKCGFKILDIPLSLSGITAN